MANYSTDANLALYEADITRFNTLSDKHTAAKAEIDRKLKSSARITAYLEGVDKTDPAEILTDNTIAGLKVCSCYYVLYLAYNAISISAMDDYAEKAKNYNKLFISQYADTVIEVDTAGGNDTEDSIRPGNISL